MIYLKNTFQKKYLDALSLLYQIDDADNVYPLQTGFYFFFNKDCSKIIVDFNKDWHYMSPVFLIYRKEYDFDINIQNVYDKIKNDFITYKSRAFTEKMRNGYIIYDL